MKDYTPVGVLEGRFYTREGEVTEEWKELQVLWGGVEGDAGTAALEEWKEVQVQLYAN